MMEAVTHAPCRVVIADDTPEIRTLLRMALETEGGFEIVGEASDGAEALSLSDDHMPDAIVLDLAMPVMDGLEAIPMIRKSNPSAKILVLSGFEAARMKDEALEAGADAYMEKGEPAQRIVQILQELCPKSLNAKGSPASLPDLRVIEDGSVASVEADKVAETFSSLAHELMTPVTVVQGFAETIADRIESLDDDTVREWALTIARNASNMASIIRSFRETARLETGDVELDLENIELNHLIKQTIVDLGAVMRERKVHVDAPEAVEIRADQVKVRQIVTNLLSNSEKFSPLGTPIEVSVAKGVFYVEVCVRDHGRGVAPDQRNALFQKFSRLDAPEPGSGLGLYICRRLARAHGGDVIYKDAEGGGASFCLRLPLPVV
jgi:DNA-binding NarL/FixJ family response regulator